MKKITNYDLPRWSGQRFVFELHGVYHNDLKCKDGSCRYCPMITHYESDMKHVCIEVLEWALSKTWKKREDIVSEISREIQRRGDVLYKS